MPKDDFVVLVVIASPIASIYAVIKDRRWILRPLLHFGVKSLKCGQGQHPTIVGRFRATASKKIIHNPLAITNRHGVYLERERTLGPLRLPSFPK
jgi:hypothetical protein